MSNLLLPTGLAERRSYLKRAVRHGEKLRPLLEVGAPVVPLCDYVAANPDLVSQRSEAGLAIRYGDLVRWDVFVGSDERILGHSASGYRELMEALGIDLGGHPYFAGDG